MVKLAIRSIAVDNVPIQKWVPENSQRVCIFVRVSISHGNQKGTDDFVIHVATPQGLMERESNQGIVGVRVLVIDSYDPHLLTKWIHETVERCQSDSWNSSVDNLRHSFDWEFEFEKSTRMK
jgi:hypothetical protein